MRWKTNNGSQMEHNNQKKMYIFLTHLVDGGYPEPITATCKEFLFLSDDKPFILDRL
jgi:hypothetical protein